MVRVLRGSLALALALVTACGALLDIPEGVVASADAEPRGDGAFVPSEAGGEGAASEAGDGDAGPVVPPPPDADCPASHGPTMIRIDTTTCVDSTEITAGQYMEFTRAADAAAFAPASCGWNTTFTPDYPSDQAWPPTPATQNYPIIGVDWCDAATFCRWAGKNLCGAIAAGGTLDTSSGYRNSAVAQWFKACSHDGQQAFPYPGDASADACASDFQDFGGPGGAAEVRTMKGCVGGYPGIFDMAGNVEEWIDACDSADPKSYCIVQGGSTSYNLPGCATHTSFTRDNTSTQLGFRCCARL